MPSINLSVNPTYYCNFRCNFCYLSPVQLSDRRRASLDNIESRLTELNQHGYIIDHVDLYGGEVGLLEGEYLFELDKVFQRYNNPSVNVITNLSSIHPYFLEEHVELSVSFDFGARERHEQVLRNILRTPKDVSILMLASPALLAMDVDELITIFNQMGNVVSVEIKPYSENQSNQIPIKFSQFEDFVIRWIKSPIPKKFLFVNDDQILKSLNGTRVAFSKDHLYITPNAKFAVLEFDEFDREFFLELDNLSQYEEWKSIEVRRVHENKFCSKCEFIGKCLTEHYRDVRSLEHSCNGFKHLLEWRRDLQS